MKRLETWNFRTISLSLFLSSFLLSNELGTKASYRSRKPTGRSSFHAIICHYIKFYFVKGIIARKKRFIQVKTDLSPVSGNEIFQFNNFIHSARATVNISPPPSPGDISIKMLKILRLINPAIFRKCSFVIISRRARGAGEILASSRERGTCVARGHVLRRVGKLTVTLKRLLPLDEGPSDGLQILQFEISQRLQGLGRGKGDIWNIWN